MSLLHNNSYQQLIMFCDVKFSLGTTKKNSLTNHTFGDQVLLQDICVFVVKLYLDLFHLGKNNKISIFWIIPLLPRGSGIVIVRIWRSVKLF